MDRRALIAIFQAKRTKNILKNRFLLSEKRVNMNAETTGDQASTESALTPPPTLNTRVVIDAADRDLCLKKKYTPVAGAAVCVLWASCHPEMERLRFGVGEERQTW
jgi:hypothetical protein